MSGNPALLIVDDEEVHRMFVAAVLRPQGWVVHEARSGTDALAMIGREAFALVLMDIQMPGMNGLETTVAIRARGDCGNGAIVPIIAFTALDGKALEQEMKAAGMDGHLFKPCTPETLVATVARWRPLDGGESTARLSAIFGKDEMDHLLARLEERLSAALKAAEDPAEAKAIAHGLAGVAGTLGFPEVHHHWLALSEGDIAALGPARDAARKALLLLRQNSR